MSTDLTDGLRTTLHLRATVRHGKRIEITSDELREGESIDVFLVMPNRAAPGYGSIVEFLDSLPAGPRSYCTWDDLERRFQDERNAWDR
ncbi:MAG TPA: hypothetical protein PK867_17525 [Pirellulales bacterium]|nr:hypothetical protein [Pirellulales bacterium]